MDAITIQGIRARQKASILKGIDPRATIERIREIRAELEREGIKPPPIRKLGWETKAWYKNNPEVLKEILS